MRQVVAPVGAGFVVLVLMTLVAARLPVPRPGRPRRVRDRTDLRALLRYLAVTAAGGYAVFLTIITVFSVGIVGDTDALRSAALSGAFLGGLGIALFLLLAVVDGRRPRRG